MFIGISTALSSVRRFISPYVKSGLKLYYRFLNRDDNPISHASTGSTSFDGTDDYISTASISTLGITTSFTVSIWAKINSYGDGDSLLGAVSDNNLDDGFAFYINSDTMKFFVNHFENNVATFALSGITSTEWNHYTGVYDGTNIHLYINA